MGLIEHAVITQKNRLAFARRFFVFSLNQALLYNSSSLHKRQLGKYLQYRRINDIDKECTNHWHD